MVTQTKPKTRQEYVSDMIDAMMVGDWSKLNDVVKEGLTYTTQQFNDDSEDYDDAIDSTTTQLVDNSQSYLEKHAKEFAGDALLSYVSLVAQAELQMGIADVVKTVNTGRIERITHPDLSSGGVCPRCRELEGTHEPDEDDLYWSHPNCHCEWQPEVTSFSSNQNKNGNLTSSGTKRIIGRDMTTQTVSFKDYDQKTREEFARKGWALKDGSFPIANKQDVINALHRIGTTNHNRATVIAHIRKRAKALGVEDVLGDKTMPKASHGVTLQLKDAAVFSNRITTEDGMVVRRGKVFEAGARLDMHGIPFITTQEDLNQMVLNFKPIPVGSGHPEAPSPLDGHLGTVTNLYLGQNPNDLCAEVHIPPFVNDVLETKGEGKVSMIFNRHTKEPLGLDFVSDPNVRDAALMASFAKTRHDTPDGQKFMQSVHDACSKRGAICKRDTSKHASRHEVAAVQQFHDIAAQHGAKCSGNVGFAKKQKGSTMNWTEVFKGFFKAAEEHDTGASNNETTSFAEDPNDFEANWQEEKMGGMGEEAAVELPDDYEANWAEEEGNESEEDSNPGGDQDDEFNPAKPTEANPMTETVSNATVAPKTAEDAKFATMLARNVQLEAELARERAVRIEAEAVAFANAEITGNRSLPAEREMLIELYRQASADDATLGEVKLSDGNATSRCERLKTMFSSRTEHWMTKEQLENTLSPAVIAMAQKTARESFDGVTKPMDSEKKRELLSHTPAGRATLKAMETK